MKLLLLQSQYEQLIEARKDTLNMLQSKVTMSEEGAKAIQNAVKDVEQSMLSIEHTFYADYDGAPD